MAKITLDIEDKNLSTVLTILENLKSGLIKNIHTQGTLKKTEPVSSSVNSTSKKRYLSKEKYKQKLNQKPLEDGFLAGKTSTGKYLSPNDYKNRLNTK